MPLRYRIPRIPRALWISLAVLLVAAGTAAATGLTSQVDELPPIADSDAELALALERAEEQLELRPAPSTRRSMLRGSRPVSTRQSFAGRGFWIFAGDNRMPASDWDVARSGARDNRASAWPGREVVWVAGGRRRGSLALDLVLRPRAPRRPARVYDTVTELDVDASRGRLLLTPNGGDRVENLVDLPGGHYRARISRVDAERRMLVELWRTDARREPAIVR